MAVMRCMDYVSQKIFNNPSKAMNLGTIIAIIFGIGTLIASILIFPWSYGWTVGLISGVAVTISMGIINYLIIEQLGSRNGRSEEFHKKLESLTVPRQRHVFRAT